MGASPVAEHRLEDTRAQQVWHLGLVVLWHVESLGQVFEPVSPALAGRFLTTGAPEKSQIFKRFTKTSVILG